VRQQRTPAAARPAAEPPARSHDPHVRHLEGELQRVLGTPVRIQVGSGQTGRVEIPFYGNDDFERIMELLLGTEASRI